jgi:hypothetical protein
MRRSRPVAGVTGRFSQMAARIAGKTEVSAALERAAAKAGIDWALHKKCGEGDLVAKTNFLVVPSLSLRMSLLSG